MVLIYSRNETSRRRDSCALALAPLLLSAKAAGAHWTWERSGWKVLLHPYVSGAVSHSPPDGSPSLLGRCFSCLGKPLMVARTNCRLGEWHVSKRYKFLGFQDHPLALSLYMLHLTRPVASMEPGAGIPPGKKRRSKKATKSLVTRGFFSIQKGGSRKDTPNPRPTKPTSLAMSAELAPCLAGE